MRQLPEKVVGVKSRLNKTQSPPCWGRACWMWQVGNGGNGGGGDGGDGDGGDGDVVMVVMIGSSGVVVVVVW